VYGKRLGWIYSKRVDIYILWEIKGRGEGMGGEGMGNKRGEGRGWEGREGGQGG